MSQTPGVVSLHPYFKAHPGKIDAVRAMLPAFVEKSTGEAKSLYYEFTSSGDLFFCREGYIGAEGVLTHLGNVGELLGQLLQITDLHRFEVHGPAAELEKLKDALGPHNPQWFVVECGVKR